MQPPLWWFLQSGTLLALIVGTLLAYASSGRVGRHSPYGTFLFVIAFGLWSLTIGLGAYMATVAVDAWDGPPGWGDVFTMLGWAILVLSFLLLLLRFPEPSPHRLGSGGGLLAIPLLSGAAFALVAWYRTTGLAAMPDAEALVRTGYLFLDGVMLATFALTVPILVRLRRATLGRLYIHLAIGLTLKSLADILFLIWPRDPPLGLLFTSMYPTAGLIAVVGLAFHHHAVAPLTERQVLADPAFLEPQLVLRDAARGMRGLAGELGERLVLDAGQRALRDAGVHATVREGTLLASAPVDRWEEALGAARDSAVAVLGRPAEAIFDSARAAFTRHPVEVLP